eukprot:GHVU01147909.1.p1 GENE.GHVU01147909.1~~GHVU01147909.1.p1  ORF type:complete len:216 (+),score=34.22 GHVU01147909.1:1270-1917(+)
MLAYAQFVYAWPQLRKDIQRLEGLKKAVLSSIQERDGEADEDNTFASRMYMNTEYLNSAAPLTMQELSGESPATDAYMRYARSPDLVAASTNSLPGDRAALSSSHGGGGQSHRRDDSAAIDGKNFFRAARNRLNYEQFNCFLLEIRKMNGRSQSRDETLTHVHNIFTDAHDDLFQDFKKLVDQTNGVGMQMPHGVGASMHLSSSATGASNANAAA